MCQGIFRSGLGSYRAIWLILIVGIGCGESGTQAPEGELAAPPVPPQMRMHRVDISDDLWGPDALTDTDGIYIEWEVNPDETVVGYHVYRSTGPIADFTRIARVPAAVSFYEDADVKLETKYYYRVTAIGEVNSESTMSQAACYTLLRKPILTHPPNQAVLDAPPTFRWLGVGETGFHTVRVFVDADSLEQPYREIWRHETIDFDAFEVDYNEDSTAIEPLLPGREYRWRVDFEERPAVGSESAWRFFQIRPN